MIYSQYRVVIVNLDPTIGSEINKKRPCLIISPNEMNFNINTVVVCPITSKSKDYPTRIKFTLNSRESYIVIDQIRTIDKKRILDFQGIIPQNVIVQVKSVINETFVK
jgi:mRNA interferase MazF